MAFPNKEEKGVKACYQEREKAVNGAQKEGR